MRTALLFVLSVIAAAGQDTLTLSNDRISVAIAPKGGSIVRVALQGEDFSPFGDRNVMGRILGHFVCVDGFGPSSTEERAAGLPMHGEAHSQIWEVAESGPRSIRFVVKLPIVQETFSRTLTLVDGENVVYVDSELESHLGFDRPVNWGEHPSIAAPFLVPEKVVVDVSGIRSRTRVHPERIGPVPRRLVSATDFTWPLAPGVAGGNVDVRFAPANPNSLDHVTTLVTESRAHGFVTALHTERNYLLGYLFRREEYPWVQDWQSYPKDLRMFRGLEFATQPFDVPRREAITLNTMFGAPTYRWLPARSKIGSRFLMFWSRTPAGFMRVDDVRLEGGSLIVEDRTAGKRLVLPASKGL